MTYEDEPERFGERVGLPGRSGAVLEGHGAGG